MNTTPVVDKSKPAPPQGRVFIADSLGRLTPAVYEQFRTHRAATAYWWAMARQNVVAFLADPRLPDELGLARSNAGLTRELEPPDLVVWIDQAEREYREEGAGFDEGLDLARANSIFNAARA